MRDSAGVHLKKTPLAWLMSGLLRIFSPLRLVSFCLLTSLLREASHCTRLSFCFPRLNRCFRSRVIDDDVRDVEPCS